MSTCVSCNRKFAAPFSATNTHLCRNCRSSIPTSLVAATSSSPAVTKSHLTQKSTSNSQKLLLTSTPKTAAKSGGGGSGGSGGKQGGSGSGGLGSGRNLVPMRCKMCNTCFRYRRCLFRHLRENHPGIFSNKDIYSHVTHCMCHSVYSKLLCMLTNIILLYLLNVHRLSLKLLWSKCKS